MCGGGGGATLRGWGLIHRPHTTSRLSSQWNGCSWTPFSQRWLLLSSRTNDRQITFIARGLEGGGGGVSSTKERRRRGTQFFLRSSLVGLKCSSHYSKKPLKIPGGSVLGANELLTVPWITNIKFQLFMACLSVFLNFWQNLKKRKKNIYIFCKYLLLWGSNWSNWHHEGHVVNAGHWLAQLEQPIRHF